MSNLLLAWLMFGLGWGLKDLRDSRAPAVGLGWVLLPLALATLVGPLNAMFEVAVCPHHYNLIWFKVCGLTVWKRKS